MSTPPHNTIFELYKAKCHEICELRCELREMRMWHFLAWLLGIISGILLGILRWR